jgi:hypothetical protein
MRVTRNKYTASHLEAWEEIIAYIPWYDTDRIENDASNNSSIVVYIRYRGNVSTVLLPSNDRGIFNGPSCYIATIGGIHTDKETDGKDLLFRPLRWAEMPWYTYQVS